MVEDRFEALNSGTDGQGERCPDGDEKISKRRIPGKNSRNNAKITADGRETTHAPGTQR